MFWLRPRKLGEIVSTLWKRNEETGKRRKNLWGRKCVRREIFWTVERVTFTLYLGNGHWVTVRPVRGHLTPIMNITFIIRSSMLNIFLFNNFFERSSIFRENREKLFCGTFDDFLGKRGVTPKIDIAFLITNY